jgi:hypothetical protein
MKVRAKVHMFEAAEWEAKAPIGLYIDTKELFFRTSEDIPRGKGQHLYITTDEKIEEGDWYYGVILGVETVQLCDNKEHEIELTATKYLCRKVIASTDPKLKLKVVDRNTCKPIASGIMHKYKNIQLPQIPQQFIKEYCKAGGIEEVDVEYEEYMTEGWIPSYSNPDNSNLDQPAELDYRIKVNPDNTINITSIKDSWSRDEVGMLMHRTAEHVLLYSETNLEDWIKENL